LCKCCGRRKPEFIVVNGFGFGFEEREKKMRWEIEETKQHTGGSDACG